MTDLSEIESIKAEVAKLNARIDALRLSTLTIELAAACIELRPGERYAGAILRDDGQIDYHLILLPGDADEINWEDAGAWAKEQGGDLPNRREQSLLIANLKGEFEQAWYWSSEQRAGYPDYAWLQYFYFGDQSGGRKSLRNRARAVRRSII